MAIKKMHGDGIKVTQLYYARAAADLGSFSCAATSLGVTQPALSHGIATLERSLGGPLFDRSTTGVTPTPLATRLLPHLHDLLGSLEAMITEARTAVGATIEPLRMGVSPLIHPTLVARAFQAAREHEPAALILKENDLAELRVALLNRSLDLILVPAVTQAPECSRRIIDSEPIHYLASAAASHNASHNASNDPVELSDLSGQPLVMVGEACGLTTFTRALFQHTGAELRPYPGEADSYRSLESWANLGLGGALLPLSRFQHSETTHPVHNHGRLVTISYEALWFPRTARSPAIEALLEALVNPS
nr:LysR family transcriptional regulator [Frankia sp. Cas4]